MSRIVTGVPNVVVYAAVLGAGYYFFVYETDEAKAKREALKRQQGMRR
jgi:hypothetical protein